MKKPVPRTTFLRGSLLSLAVVAGCAPPRSENVDMPMPSDKRALQFFSPQEYRTVAALAERIFPADASGPGATDLHVADYIDGRLAGAFGWGARMYKQGPFLKPETSGHGWQVPQTPRDAYRDSLQAVDDFSNATYGALAANLPADRQDDLLRDIEAGKPTNFNVLEPKAFFAFFLAHVNEGLFADPRYGGNAQLAGWKLVGFPGDPMAYGDPYEKLIDRYGVPYDVAPKGLA